MAGDTGRTGPSGWVIGVGAVAAVSVVVAALVIFSSGSGGTTRTERQAAVAVDGDTLVLGRADAPHRVVVWEDFGCRPCRDLDVASRDFLDITAGLGDVRVEYHPYAATADAWSQRALRAWLAVAKAGTPRQARSFHDLLIDLQPEPGETGPEDADLADAAARAGVDRQAVADALAAGSPDVAGAAADARAAAVRAGISRVPTVVLDGRPLDAADGTALADQLQARITEGE